MDTNLLFSLFGLLLSVIALTLLIVDSVNKVDDPLRSLTVSLLMIISVVISFLVNLN